MNGVIGRQRRYLQSGGCSEEIRTRWGVDVDDARADPAALRVAIERAERERTGGEVERWFLGVV